MRPRHTTAFSLIEMMMVLAVMGIVAAIVVPQFGASDDLKLSAAARTVMADLTYAQSRAISTQKKHYVQFVGQQYTLLSRATDAAALAAIAHPVSRGTFTIGFGTGAQDGVSVVSVTFGGSTILSFDELGSPMAYVAAGNTNTTLSSPGSIRLQSGASVLKISIEQYTVEMTLIEG
ncbi:MAG: prepilin-type N-terminal cleavage/methylation domain-containing protein [Burkholderiales bacterium]|nr:prepilin-type N-terminal cleavage/methylation domain-containing protein [Phycisphaerae bacterium]